MEITAAAAPSEQEICELKGGGGGRASPSESLKIFSGAIGSDSGRIMSYIIWHLGSFSFCAFILCV